MGRPQELAARRERDLQALGPKGSRKYQGAFLADYCDVLAHRWHENPNVTPKEVHDEALKLTRLVHSRFRPVYRNPHYFEVEEREPVKH